MTQARILLVEDDGDFRAVLTELLAAEGYLVDGAANGVEALERMRRGPVPDLVLLNLNMPVMNGWEFRAEQKRDPALAATPVVVFSGDDAPKTAVDAAHHLKKPFGPTQLFDCIEHTLGRFVERIGGARTEPGGPPPAPGAFAAPEDDRLVGQMLPGGLRLVRRIGSGGMSLVYEAERILDGKMDRFAVKLLNSPLAARPEVVQRFTNEARAVGLLRHPNIVQAVDVGATEQGLPFLVLELLAGDTLEEEIAKVGPFPIGRAIRIARQVASAIAAAHAQGIVHRDIKPANIFLVAGPGDTGGDHAKVLDFGVSKFMNPWDASGTQTGDIIGTPNYMAPEQLSDARTVDLRVDIYGLAATLYEMLTGHPPFGGGNFPVLFLEIMTRRPPPAVEERPDLPVELERVLERALAKSPEARWPTMEALAEELLPFEKLDQPPRVVPRKADAPRHRGASNLPPRLVTKLRPAGAGTWITVALVLGVLLGSFGISMRSSHTVGLLSAPAGERPATVMVRIGASQEGAKVNLRGTLYALPFQGTFKTSSQREPIEISAPGYAGRRFWLVLDEPRRLWVDLPRGAGMRDAADGEIRRALDEGLHRMAP